MFNFSRTLKDLYTAYDDRATEFGKWLGYKALRLKRRYRLRQAAKEDFIRRNGSINEKSSSFVRSFTFEVAIYFIVFSFIIFILVQPTRIEPTNRPYTPRFPNANTYTPIEVITGDSPIEYKEEETTESVEDSHSFEFEIKTDEEVISEEDYEEPETDDESCNLYGLSDREIDMLVQAVQHETNYDPSYYVNGDFNTVQQLTTASIVNRIGQPGFGVDYSTPNNLTEVLANPIQYGNILNELSWFDSNDWTTRQNVMAVITGEVWVPDDLYFERCSSYGEDYWTAQTNFEAQYNNCYTYYTSETWEAKDYYGTGVFIMFGVNPNGAY